MSLDEESLETAANGGSIDLEKWPSMVEPLLDRLEYIIHNAFVMPVMPPEGPSMVLDQNPITSFLHDPSAIPSSSNKENAAPPDLQTPPRPPPTSMLPPSSTDRIPDSQPASQVGASSTNLPGPLQLLLDSIRSTMRSLFTSKPPHTIQRLAELILRPNSHYRTLPAYLRAVDRVVSVTSTADIFPLPQQASVAQLNGVLNGAENTFVFAENALGSDESLGGALLTPIPWLSNVASPDADAAAVMDEGNPYHLRAPLSLLNLLCGHMDLLEESISDIPISGAESIQDQQVLLQETETTQQHIIPTQSETVSIENEVMGGAAPTTDDAEEFPHARGPSLLGVEDLGLQDGKGVQMTLLNTGSGSESQTEDLQSTPAQLAQGSGETQTSLSLASNEDADGDGDISLADESSVTPADKDQQA